MSKLRRGGYGIGQHSYKHVVKLRIMTDTRALIRTPVQELVDIDFLSEFSGHYEELY